jgi:hypothetical protein
MQNKLTEKNISIHTNANLYTIIEQITDSWLQIHTIVFEGRNIDPNDNTKLNEKIGELIMVQKAHENLILENTTLKQAVTTTQNTMDENIKIMNTAEETYKDMLSVIAVCDESDPDIRNNGDTIRQVIIYKLRRMCERYGEIKKNYKIILESIGFTGKIENIFNVEPIKNILGSLENSIPTLLTHNNTQTENVNTFSMFTNMGTRNFNDNLKNLLEYINTQSQTGNVTRATNTFIHTIYHLLTYVGPVYNAIQMCREEDIKRSEDNNPITKITKDNEYIKKLYNTRTNPEFKFRSYKRFQTDYPDSSFETKQLNRIHAD